MIAAFVRSALLVALGCGLPSAAAAACTVQKLADLPVTMSGLRPMVSARINGREGSFIADSGAFFSLISPGMAAAAGLRVMAAPPSFRITGIGGDTSAFYTTVKDLILAGIPLHNMEFFVGGTDTGTAGLLGQNILGGIGDVEYDLPDGVIRLMRSHDCGHANLAYWAPEGAYTSISLMERNQANPHTIGTITINGSPIRATFDTGAPTSILSLEAAARAGVKPGDPGVEPAGFTGGLGRSRVPVWFAHFASVKIGDEVVHNPRLRIGDIGLKNSDMLIGADFFISHRVYVANSVRKMFLTYTGGNIFDQTARRDGEQVSAPTQDQAQAPSDAEGFSRRGAVFAAQHDLTRALADFSKAIELAPHEARYRLERAHAYLFEGKPESALADLDQAITLDPNDVPALIERAQLRVARHERAPALADLDAAARAVAGPAMERLEIAGLYDSLEAPEGAIVQYDIWIPAHHEDARLAQALNGRCWSRALAGQDLNKALGDCDAALHLRPHTAAFLDSRGLVRLRMGDWDRAIADYDESLKLTPKSAWSLFGRGIAKRHKGQTTEAQKDIDDAVAIAPNLPARAKRAGIS